MFFGGSDEVVEALGLRKVQTCPTGPLEYWSVSVYTLSQ